MSEEDIPQKNSKNTGFTDQEILTTFGWSPEVLQEFKEDLLDRYRTADWDTNDQGIVNLRTLSNKIVSNQLSDDVIEAWNERFGTTHGLSTNELKLRIIQVLRARKNHVEGEQKKKEKGRKRIADEDASSARASKKRQTAAPHKSGNESAPRNEAEPPQDGTSDSGRRKNEQQRAANRNQGTPTSGDTALDPSMVDTFTQKFVTCVLQKSDEADWATRQLTQRCKTVLETTVKQAVAAEMDKARDDWLQQDHPQSEALTDTIRRALTQDGVPKSVHLRTLRLELHHSKYGSQIVFLGVICSPQTADIVRTHGPAETPDWRDQVAVRPHTAKLKVLKEEVRLHRGEDVFLGGLTYEDPVDGQTVNIEDDESLRIAICLFHRANKRTLPIKVVE
ncbi:hypothetical protein SLS54_008819 [Diplodia seriata]